MKANELIDLNQRNFIRNIFENLSKEKKPMRFWQDLNKPDDYFWAKVSGIDLTENSLYFNPYRCRGFKLLAHPFIYFHTTYRQTLFKTSIKERNQFRLEVKIPQFIKIHEGRREQRRVFNKASSKSASVKLDGVGKGKEVFVIDLSNNGTALNVDNIFYRLCEVGSLITICSKNTPEINNKIAVIRNKGEFYSDPHNPHKVSYRIGLALL